MPVKDNFLYTLSVGTKLIVVKAIYIPANLTKIYFYKGEIIKNIERTKIPDEKHCYISFTNSSDKRRILRSGKKLRIKKAIEEGNCSTKLYIDEDQISCFHCECFSDMTNYIKATIGDFKEMTQGIFEIDYIEPDDL
ncbi:MAG: hypothetical protein GY795_32385 [Desulfobacterales bacterium]|nr:hypothetical protein [Desulfobacterales bacterium]